MLYQVPRSALRDDGHLLIVDAEERLRFRAVEPVRIATDVVFIDAELEDGELVCISPIAVAVEGMPVRIFNDEADSEKQTTELQ